MSQRINCKSTVLKGPLKTSIGNSPWYGSNFSLETSADWNVLSLRRHSTHDEAAVKPMSPFQFGNRQSPRRIGLSDRRKQQMATELHKPVWCRQHSWSDLAVMLFGCLLFSAIICQTDFHASLTPRQDFNSIASHSNCASSEKLTNTNRWKCGRHVVKLEFL